MLIPSHPRWGRAIGTFTTPAHRNRLTLSVDLELTGLQAMEQISRLAADGHLPAQIEIEIGICTLESALLLALDPMTIRHLANPPVISGCVRLMKTVIDQRQGTVSPFSYEYGFLCFNLLVLCLNICLLERWNQLDQPLEMGCLTPYAAAHVWTSIEVSYAVIDQFNLLKDGWDCDVDWVLGWSTSGGYPRQTLLLPQSDIASILRMLWDDRKLFLKFLTLHTLDVPGLSGLLFLFSRYVTQTHDSEQDRDADILKTSLYELALRYQLVADAYQGEANMKVIYANIVDYDTWTQTPKHIDGEDSSLIMTAFIKQVDNYDESDISLLVGNGPTVLAQLIPFAIDAHSHDLLPEVLRCSIQSGWLWLLGMEDYSDSETLIKMLFPTLVWLIRPRDQLTRLPLSTQMKIVDVLHDGDLINLSACAIIRLSPAKTEPESFTTKIITGFFRILTEALPENELRRRFWDFAPDWVRFYEHINIVAYGIPTVPSPQHQEHYRAYINTWVQIASSLDLLNAPYFEGVSECFSGRCPRAYPNDTAIFGCAGCAVAVYCDDRCQSMGWMFGHLNPPHRQLCRTNTKQY
ncbi:hypothetical protein V565_146200 [Rhizoctonia solani 123E]|uniref:MYND-type domain-containing protein n=1 Tax=Rhizoctonia solani 123E TaxID=1423351 RepID=A0A074RST9_9AGAM|nr:hypothetical protein V565_146200 [Rhizoctonia solani 123E]